MGNSGRRDREAENAGGHYLFRMRDWSCADYFLLLKP